MPRQMIYTNSANKSIALNDATKTFNYGDIRSHSWDYSSGYNKIRTFSRSITSKKFNVFIHSDATNTANELFDIMDYDVQVKEHGKLTIGEYYIKGYITSIVPTQVRDDYIKCEITFTTDEPFWLKETTTHFYAGGGTDGFEYPYDYEFDYSNSLSIMTITNQSYVPSDFRVVLFGSVENPKITIANHDYSVNASIGSNEYLTIDSYEKKIYKTANDGTITNLFDKRDKDSYIFQKIPVGTSAVSWDSDVKFDVTLIEQRSEPKWI